MISLKQRYTNEARQFDSDWQAFERGENRIARGLGFAAKIDRLARIIYVGRQVRKENLRDEEDHLATQFQRLSQLAGPRKDSDLLPWIVQYRLLWREHFGIFLFTLVTFVSATLLGLGIGLNHSDFIPAIVSAEMMEKILDHVAWFERLQANPLMGALEIAVNNIKVSILCFLGGAVLGLGGWWILASNGLMLGMIFGFCMKNDFHDRLADFISAHGFLELTVIIASAFASFLVGQCFWRRPFKTFRQRIGQASVDGFNIMLGVTPWLILAGALEGFVSPFPSYSQTQKLVLGIVVTVAFWAWTFWPIPSGSKT